VAEDEDIRFALGVIDDNQRLVAAGKAYRWDVVKWAVTLNVALAGASTALRQQHTASGPFLLFAIGVAAGAIWLVYEVNRRMTITRNDGVAPEQYLIEHHNIDVKGITGKEPVTEFSWAHDRSEIWTYYAVVVASVLPTFIVWRGFSG
jgi:hypothetical protein